MNTRTLAGKLTDAPHKGDQRLIHHLRRLELRPVAYTFDRQEPREVWRGREKMLLLKRSHLNHAVGCAVREERRLLEFRPSKSFCLVEIGLHAAIDIQRAAEAITLEARDHRLDVLSVGEGRDADR